METDGPTGLELIDLLADVAKEVRASADLTDAVLKDGIVRTLEAKKAGNEKLWKFMDDAREKKMLFLFGLPPKARE